MSMDLAVWSQTPFKLPEQLPEPANWEEHHGEWTFGGEGWQVLVLEATDEPESIVSERLTGAAYVAYVSLEPIGATKDAYVLLERAVRSLAKSSDGIWVDSFGEAHLANEGSFE